VDRQGVAPGLRLRRGAVGRGFGCGSGRLGINVHRELETDLCRGPWFEFPGRRHHGAGRPFVALDDPQDPAHQATIASGAENAVRAFRPVVCLPSAPLARRSHPCRRGGEARLTQARQFLIADVRLRRRRGRHVRPSRRASPSARASARGSSIIAHPQSQASAAASLPHHLQ
jgi:hypothetical protein